MKVFTADKIRIIDTLTIENTPINSLDLMNNASKSIFDFIIKNFDSNITIILFAGKGNNGGDALALANQLLMVGYNIRVYTIFLSKTPSKDCKVNYQHLLNKNIAIHHINSVLDFPKIQNSNLVIDGIFGTGLQQPPQGIFDELIQYINNSTASIISIDIPSGIPSEPESYIPTSAIKATYTISFQFPKLSFFFKEYAPFVGKWIITDIGLHQPTISNMPSSFYYTTKQDITKTLKKRCQFDHKGIFGHALLMNGSKGKIGAAILASKACLRSGCGLITSFLPEIGIIPLISNLPETMYITEKSDYLSNLPDEINRFDAIACGCGIGKEKPTQELIHSLLKTVYKPLVLDADAINIIAENNWQNLVPPNTVLTPHPKEFDRLLGKSNSSYERILKGISYCKIQQTYMVIKGANTAVICPDETVYFNSSGNPGMATAGSGDVLTGIITGLLAQKYSPKDAAIAGVFLHGLAGDCAATKHSEQGLIASDIIDNICEAYLNIDK